MTMIAWLLLLLPSPSHLFPAQTGTFDLSAMTLPQAVALDGRIVRVQGVLMREPGWVDDRDVWYVQDEEASGVEWTVHLPARWQSRAGQRMEVEGRLRVLDHGDGFIEVRVDRVVR